jgi:hypothetical protein
MLKIKYPVREFTMVPIFFFRRNLAITCMYIIYFVCLQWNTCFMPQAYLHSSSFMTPDGDIYTVVLIHVSDSIRECMQNVDGLESDRILHSADLHMNRLYIHTYIHISLCKIILEYQVYSFHDWIPLSQGKFWAKLMYGACPCVVSFTTPTVYLQDLMFVLLFKLLMHSGTKVVKHLTKLKKKIALKNYLEHDRMKVYIY